MIRKTKALGLAFVAVVAMSAVVASGAQASQFTASSYPATGTGEQPAGEKHTFTVQGQNVTCSKAHFKGTLTAASETLKVVPEYKECTAFGFGAEVDMNSCYFDFTSGPTSSTPTHHYKGSVHIKCTTPGDTITVNAPASNSLCVVHIPEQTPTKDTVDYEPTLEVIHVTSTVEQIHSVVTDIGGFFCPLSSASTDTTGKYVGKVAFGGTEGTTPSIS